MSGHVLVCEHLEGLEAFQTYNGIVFWRAINASPVVRQTWRTIVTEKQLLNGGGKIPDHGADFLLIHYPEAGLRFYYFQCLFDVFFHRRSSNIKALAV